MLVSCCSWATASRASLALGSRGTFETGFRISPWSFQTRFLREWNFFEIKLHTNWTSRLPEFFCWTIKTSSYNISITTRIPLKRQEHRGSIGRKSSRDRFWKRKRLEEELVMTLISLLDDSDVIVTLIITNFIFILIIQLWRSFFQIFVNGDVVNVQTWEELCLKNPIEPP